MPTLEEAIIAGGILPERAGIIIREALRTGLPLAMACVMRMKESEGGRNIYGHDRGACSNFPGRNVEVTRENYQEYLACVRNGGKRNGVGPDQLTWRGYQEEADRRGGCWRPEINIAVGSEILAGHYKRHGAWEAFKRYNGKPIYADQAIAMLPRWERIIAGAGEMQRPNVRRGDANEHVRRLRTILNEVTS